MVLQFKVITKKKEYDIPDTMKMEDCWILAFGTIPATIHLSIKEAEDFAKSIADEGVDTDKVKIVPAKLPPLAIQIMRKIDLEGG